MFGRAVHMTELELLLKRRYRNLTCNSCEKESCPLDVSLHLLFNQGQRLLCSETARRANCDGEAVKRILGLTGDAIDGDLKAKIFLQLNCCNTNVHQ